MHVLSWYELIPVVSWLIQRGRCTHCHKSIA
ncbi:prepilin peptidase [Patescibacteria group bacterium]|nr:prepilin peptidase [Patescibacteria group bacterium]